MLAVEININGEKRCVASTTPNLVLAVGLTWMQRDPDHLRFNIGGITADGNNTGDHFDFPVNEPKIGDEMTIRIVETDSPDEPERIYNPATDDTDRD